MFWAGCGISWDCLGSSKALSTILLPFRPFTRWLLPVNALRSDVFAKRELVGRALLCYGCTLPNRPILRWRKEPWRLVLGVAGWLKFPPIASFGWTRPHWKLRFRKISAR